MAIQSCWGCGGPVKVRFQIFCLAAKMLSNVLHSNKKTSLHAFTGLPDCISERFADYTGNYAKTGKHGFICMSIWRFFGKRVPIRTISPCGDLHGCWLVMRSNIV
ncbi:hypothetical protein [Oxalicibacterium faecigallinarum]|uniref:hypothetical protein n=1 Tax=Oxalicibacterium faecigallinarum TaxID=573741 RepID=UPI001E4416FD|nr:hypothetical protein [Oxalicibacterium faecigallinarum]